MKREPAWVKALTWIGSGLVILGIGVMFYAPAIGKKLRQKSVVKTELKTEEASSATAKKSYHLKYLYPK
ncbi:hypothetical protein I4641_21185 [Waterburya agarophytonicola K14]|uniref:Uncharacterized protein n=1 Tax=Waterburya agarophytonicola KI4 TaxID=2874699 RepID=A0A964BTP4_9CYAN|nr:hypothetical protein [Waterburya agarophytonicola]MCC0179478.1 hypothetical protein [Waterburya agarophytonicola KI4]